MFAKRLSDKEREIHLSVADQLRKEGREEGREEGAIEGRKSGQKNVATKYG